MKPALKRIDSLRDTSNLKVGDCLLVNSAGDITSEYLERRKHIYIFYVREIVDDAYLILDDYYKEAYAGTHIVNQFVLYDEFLKANQRVSGHPRTTVFK